MTLAELLALLGRAWPRLALYPGGLALLLAAWLAWRETGNTETEGTVHPLALAERLSAAALPWLAIALMPLPFARGLERPIDAIVALALLEWPRLLIIARDHRGAPERAARRLAALLNAAPPLVLALLTIAQGAGSLELIALAAGPADAAPPWAWGVFLAGAAGLALVLPALAEAGPFASGPDPADRMLALGLRLRAIGVIVLASLPWLALLPAAGEEGAPPIWLAPLPALALLAWVWAFGRLARGRPMRRWGWACLGLSAALALALVAGAGLALRDRLA